MIFSFSILLTITFGLGILNWKAILLILQYYILEKRVTSVVYLCVIFFSMHSIFALPGWCHECILRKVFRTGILVKGWSTGEKVKKREERQNFVQELCVHTLKCLFVCPFTVCTHSFWTKFRHSFLFLPSQLHC